MTSIHRVRPFPVRTALLLLAATAGLVPALRAQCPTFWDGFRPSGVEGRVRALASWDPPGAAGPGLYVAGDFTSTADGPAAHIARWDGTYWTPLGAGIAGNVTTLCVFDDGSGERLFAGGVFLSAGGQQAFFVAAWDGTGWSPVGLGLSGNVHALCVYDDGSGPALYAGGSFSVPGDPFGLNVAKWDGTAWSVVNHGANAIVWSLAVHDDGTGAKLYAAGSFTLAGGFPAQRIASWDGAAWAPLGTGLNSSAYTLASYGGELWVGGDFGVAGGVPVDFAARWNGAQFSNAADFNLRVWRLFAGDIGGGQRLYAVGDFYVVNGVPATQIAQYDGATWSNVGGITEAVIAYECLCVHDDGGGPDLYVGTAQDVSGFNGTSFFRVGVDRVWPRRVAGIATWINPVDGSPAVHVLCDNQFGTGNAMSFGYWDGYQWVRQTDIAPYRYMRTLESVDLGQGPELYVGGSFPDLGGAPARGIARWDGTQFHALGTGLDGWVEAISAYDDGTGPALYAGGGPFTTIGGAPTPRVARFDGSAWQPVPGGPSNSVYAFCVHDDGTGPKLYASGGFTSVGGTPSAPVARWDGATWEGVGDPAYFGTSSYRHVAKMIVHDDGSGPALYGTGYLTAGTGTEAGRLIRWRNGAWSDVGGAPIGDFATGVRALATWDDGTGGGKRLYLAGDFSNAGLRVARWTGTGFEPYGGVTSPLPYEAVQDMTVVSNAAGKSELWLAGTFSHAAGVASANVARVIGCGPITSFCTGNNADPHVTTDCPCSNFGAPGRGCAWSGNASGALLQTSGDIVPDTLVLNASAMPAVASATVFWKGDALLAHAVPWGDGLRCIDGNLIRLGLKNNVNGAAQYPEAGNASISVRGQTPVGSGAVAYYQTSFRNAASFCTPYTYNTTNGVRVVW